MSKAPTPYTQVVPNSLKLKVVSTPSNDLVPTNVAYVNPTTFQQLQVPGITTEYNYAKINDHVFAIDKNRQVPPDAVALNMFQRKHASVSTNEICSVAPYAVHMEESSLASIAIDVDFTSKSAPPGTVDAEELNEHVLRFYLNQVLAVGQTWLTDFKGVKLILEVKDMEALDPSVLVAGNGNDNEKHATLTSKPYEGVLIKSTNILFTRAPNSTVKLINQKSSMQVTTIWNAKLDFENLGIGGLDKEFSDIFRRAFASRIFPQAIIDKLGINHVKGILLYGPPGTGKTLLARQIGKMLNCKEPKIVNGPEILNKYYGQSEENIRNLFIDAENEFAERGVNSDLHLIIFDEIDAICKTRGSTRDGTGASDSIVNQLLSKIDGVNQLNNVLVIGMTNRKDMIDEALLRPGRFEVHVEIGLPDEKGRLQILNIHTSKMRKNNALHEGVDLDELAARTKNFSGAEIEGLVKSATSFALSQCVDLKNVKSLQSQDLKNVAITMDDFNRALSEIKPAFGVSTDEFEAYKDDLIEYGPTFTHIMDTCRSFTMQVATSERTHLLSVLLDGPLGSGKTSVAVKTALASGFPFVKIISPENMVGFSENGKCGYITKVFSDAYKSPLSVIVLDNIERIVEYVDIGPRFSNVILQTLLILLKKAPPKNRKLLIFGTTSHVSTLRSLELVETFNISILIPRLRDREDIRRVLLHLNAFEEDEVDHALSALPNRIGIKKLILVVEMARSQGKQKVTFNRFVDCLRDCGVDLPELEQEKEEE